MQSLRTRRSQAPPRKTQRAPTVLTTKSKSRDARKSRVDDKIKKRMSMRYANISGPTELGVPGIPPLPDGVDPGRLAQYTREEGQGINESISPLDRYNDQDEVVNRNIKEDEERRMLDQDDFDPDAYLKVKLANSTEAELKSLQSSLRTAKEDVAADLQRNVFRNYAEFVLISKEISTLENELMELKESLSDYKSMPSLLHIPDPSSSSSAISTFRRSSLADLRIMYFNQMQTLHAQIEGSSKFAPTVPGRHVIAEVDDILSLNPATYKAMGKVKFVVLDDMVLVAKRRRRNGGVAAPAGNSGNVSVGSEGKLVAERCWSLQDMQILDTKDSPTMTNVFKVRHGKEITVYRTQTAADKKILLAQVRQASEEFTERKRKEREGEHERRKTMWGSGTGERSDKPSLPDWMVDLAERADGNSDAKVKAERDSRWVAEWSDDLTVAIALKEWEKAVGLIEHGKARLSTTPPLANKLPPLTSQLISSLLTALAQPSNRKSAVVSLISLLLRLGAGPSARNTFLRTREQVIKGLIRKVPFSGDVVSYIGEICIVWFTAIKHTADWFLASFKENEVSSSFVQWAKKQIEAYAKMFRKHVYSSDTDPVVVEEAMRITYAQSKKLLQEYGLDFRFLLEQFLIQNPELKDISEESQRFSFQAQSVHLSRRSTESPTLSPFLSPITSASLSSSPTKIPTVPPRRNASPAPLQPQPASIAVLSSPGSLANDMPTSLYLASAALPSSRPQTPTRTRTPTGVPSAPTSPPPPVPAPSPRRPRSPPTGSPSRSTQLTDLGIAAVSRERPPRALRGSPAPPPRSSNRPGSAISHRPAPVAVPPREGMI